MRKLKVKVCGMRDSDNISQLVDLGPDFIGFIFYEGSPRYVDTLDEEVVSRIPISIKRVGVFVNEDLDTILSASRRFGLNYVQLHGDEDLAFVQTLREKGLRIIKVFRLLDSLPCSLAAFSETSDYFLFDTQSPSYGGSGRHFDWSILKNYNLPTPYLLSGGISLDDIETIKGLELKGLEGIDVNSKFELIPGMKDVNKVEKLVKQL